MPDIVMNTIQKSQKNSVELNPIHTNRSVTDHIVARTLYIINKEPLINDINKLREKIYIIFENKNQWLGLSSTKFLNKYLVNRDFVLYKFYDSKQFYCKFLPPRLEMRKGLDVKIPIYPLLSFKNGPQGEAIAMKCLILL